MSQKANPAVVIGAGGHAKVVISVLRAAGYDVVAVYDDSPEKLSQRLLGVPIVGPIAALRDIPETKAVVAIGDCAVRGRVVQSFLQVSWITAVHPTAYVDPTVRLGAGTVVFAGAVIQPDSVLGDHVIVNTGATVDHDCRVDDFAHLAPGVHLTGGVHIGHGAFLGAGSVVTPLRSVGRGTVVGAGAVVVDDLEGGITAVGVPARPLGHGGAVLKRSRFAAP